MKKRVAFLIWYMIAIVFVGCGSPRSTIIDLSNTETMPERFTWGSISGLNVSLGDIGMFYCENDTLCYYDMEKKEEYILCGLSNCQHNNDDCNAYFRRTIAGGGADNVAQVGSYIYCTYQTENEFQLLQINPSDGSRREVASFARLYDAADEENPFYATSMGAVHYCNGYAWFMMTMQRYIDVTESTESYQQITGVNLFTGEIIELNTNDGNNYTFQVVCANTIYYMALRELEKPLSTDEFFALARDGVVSINDLKFSSYSEYRSWHTREYAKEYAIYSYNIQTREIKSLWQGTTVLIDGRQIVPYWVYGEYEGNILWMEHTKDTAGNYNSLNHIALSITDMSTGSNHVIWESERGSPLAIAQGYNGSIIFADGTFLYADNITENTADIYTYNLSDGSYKYLFTDEREITFRIFGEYKDGFWGKHKDHQSDMTFYWISKEDFYAGNLDAMIHYDVG